MTFNRQTKVAGPARVGRVCRSPRSASPCPARWATVAYGQLPFTGLPTPGKYIPPPPTLTGAPAAARPGRHRGADVPAGRAPSPPAAGRWRSSATASPTACTARRSTRGLGVSRRAGIATIVDQRRRPRRRRHSARSRGSGTAGAPVTVPAGGRGIDQNGDGTIDSHRGLERRGAAQHHQQPRCAAPDDDRSDAAGAPDRSRHRRRRRRQRRPEPAAHLLLRASPSAASTAPSCSASSRDIKAGVLNVPGGSITEIARLSPVFRPLTALALQPRGLLNLHARAAAVRRVAVQREHPAARRAAAGQQRARRDGDPADARSLPVGAAVRQPGVVRAAHPQAAAAGQCGQAGDRAVRQGDQTVPNPTTNALVRAGDLQDRMTLLPQRSRIRGQPGAPKNPHTFLTNIASGGLAPTIAVARADADRHLLRQQRRDGDRSRRCGPVLRSADRRCRCQKR